MTGNRTLMAEAMANALENVIKHAAGASECTVKVDQHGVTITDNAPDQKQWDQASPGRFGLQIIQQIVELHGGTLDRGTDGLSFEFSGP
jgi:signal transduction histidine kinase